MMDFSRVQLIPLTQVNTTDRRFQYHYWQYEREHLVRSIREHGIQTPVILESSGDNYRIVHGFRRADCAIDLNFDRIPAVIKSAPPLDNLKMSLIDNRALTDFNLYEQSKLLDIARELGANSSQIINEFLPLTGLNSHKNVYDEYRGFIRLPKQLIEFFVEKGIAVSRTQIFQTLPPDGLEIVLYLLKTFSPGINILEELLTNLYEISRREEKPVQEIYQALGVDEILEKSGAPHIALGEIRQRLQEYRYPVLNETNAELQQLTAQLQLGSNVNIHWDKRLESRGVNVTFHWEKAEEVSASTKRLSQSDTLSWFRKIFRKI